MAYVDVKGILDTYATLALKRGISGRGKTPSEVAVKILHKARDYVPVVNGRLRDSGHIELAGMDGSEYAAVKVVFDVPYAVYVHENRDAKHAEGKIAKFLEQAAIEVGLDCPYSLTMSFENGSAVLWVNSPDVGAPIAHRVEDMRAFEYVMSEREQAISDELDKLLFGDIG
jgi:hypothetical protein